MFGFDDNPFGVTLLIILAFLNAVPAVLWSTGLIRAFGLWKARPTVRRGLDGPPAGDDAPSVSIVVPAHNEERVIVDCAESLLAQRYPNLEVIIVLDRCTDRTLELLQPIADRDTRLRIVENDSCPDEWAGKCNAARIGTDHATGDRLLFTDADTQFDPDLVRAAVAVAEEKGAGLLSLLSTLTHGRSFELIVQPVASMALVYLYPIERVDHPERPRPFANGQFMLFTREAYESVGGHAGVHDHLLEDIAFARAISHAGHRCSVVFADGMLICSMYETWSAFRSGWKRIFIEGCKRKPMRMRRSACRLAALGLLAPALQVAGLLAAGLAIGAGDLAVPAIALASIVVVGWIVQAVALSLAYSMGGAPRWAVLFFPAGCWSVARILMEGASDLVRRRPLRWGGREYVLEPR